MVCSCQRVKPRKRVVRQPELISINGIKVLVTSGYAEELVPLRRRADRAAQVLRKLYQQTDLIAALREVFARM